MNSPTLRIWSNTALPEPVLVQLRTSIAPHTLHIAKGAQPSVLVGAPSDDACRESDIAFGQPDPEDVIHSKSLKWVHLTSAGYTRYDRDDVRAAVRNGGILVTNSSSVYDEPCSEHLLAMILGFARQLPRAVVDQRNGKWDHHPLRSASRLLVGQSVAIIGFGAIARRLVELLQPLRMNISAVRRTPRGDEPIRVLPTAQVDDLLATADHVVNILPAAKETRLFFDAARLARIRTGAYFYNIGRGDTVDQNALCSELESGRIAAAYLDVTTPEPLPPTDPLWSAPRCFITPHTAGGHANEYERLVKHFLENLRLFTAGGQPRDRILGN